jgi:hypothetical protein
MTNTNHLVQRESSREAVPRYTTDRQSIRSWTLHPGEDRRPEPGYYQLSGSMNRAVRSSWPGKGGNWQALVSGLGWDKLRCKLSPWTCRAWFLRAGLATARNRLTGLRTGILAVCGVSRACRIAVTRQSRAPRDVGIQLAVQMQGTEFNKDEQESSKNNTIRAAKALTRRGPSDRRAKPALTRGPASAKGRVV